MADRAKQLSYGGQYGTSVAAGTEAGATVVLAGPGRARKVIITSAATAALVLYDHASAASGTAIYASAATVPAGTIVDLDVPVTNGIVAALDDGSPACLVTYNKDARYGR